MATDDDQRVRDMSEAELRAWFGLPSFDELAEQGGVVDEERAALDKRLENRAAILEHVEPWMVWRIERHRIAGTEHRSPEVPLRPWEGRVTTFDDAAVPALPAEDEWRELEVPREIERAIDENTPQAFLRDLYRPEKEFYFQYQSPWDDDFDPPPANPMQPIRDTLRRDYRVGTTITPAQIEIDDAIGGLRAILRSPWPEAKRERARQREAELLAGKPEGADPVSREPGESS